jgi:hypothetical protein
MFEDLRSYYFSRYGLAEVLVTEMEAYDPEAAREALAETSREEMESIFEKRIGRLLRKVRVHFPSPEYPPNAEVTGEPVWELDGTPGEQVGENGYFVRPTVLLTDGQLNGYYGFINSPIPSDGEVIQRHYPPATKLSIGKSSASNVKKTRLFVLACTVTTLTPLKAARRSGESDRAAVIPDLDLPRLVTYLDLYLDLQPGLSDPTLAETNDEGKPFLKQNDGTFPNAPPAWTFGTLGVVAGIGSWARENGFFEDAEPVLEALATGRSYVIGTSGDNRVETAGSHVVGLARRGVLQRALDRAWRIETDANEEDLYRELHRWLLRFGRAQFRDFLSIRAIYPSSFSPLIDAYFMQTYDEDLIGSARAAGQHVNNQAYHAAEGSTQEAKRENKQTILASIESMLYDCSDEPEMIARLSTQVGRLTGADFPPEAQEFFDQATGGDLSVEEARNLLIAYMRLRGSSPTSNGGDSSPLASEGERAESDSPAEAAPESKPGESFDPDQELSQM